MQGYIYVDPPTLNKQIENGGSEMKIRFGLGVLAYLVPTFALGFVWHVVLFEGYYQYLAIYRKDIIIPFGFLSMLFQAFIFAWIYQEASSKDGALSRRKREFQSLIAFTRIPYLPYSIAAEFVKPRTACLLAT